VFGRLGVRNVKVYELSWLGYAVKLDARLKNEVFFNGAKRVLDKKQRDCKTAPAPEKRRKR